MDQITSKIDRVRAKLKTATSVTVLTGAGISAESGVQTFRGHGGLWENYRIEEIATPEAFAEDPEKVWEFYNMRIDKIVSIKPNPGHFALAQLEKKISNFTLITQNIDGLHQAAGSRNVIEVHGNIRKVRCTGCRKVEKIDKSFKTIPPVCSCGSMLRPHVVWFGESLDPQDLSQAMAALKCDVFLCIGTSAQVVPASMFAPSAKSQGAFTVEVNPEETPNSYVMDEVLLGKAGEILPKLVE